MEADEPSSGSSGHPSGKLMSIATLLEVLKSKLCNMDMLQSIGLPLEQQ